MSNTKKFQMKLNSRGKILWSIVAFSPLFLVLLLKFILNLFTEPNPLIKYNSIVIISVIVIVVCIFLTWLLLLWILNPGETEDLMEFECKINNSSNSDYGIFIVTYLVPFIFVNFSWVDLIPTGVMFIFIIAIYITFLKFINDYKDDPSKKAKVEEVSLLIFLLPVLQEELLTRRSVI